MAYEQAIIDEGFELFAAGYSAAKLRSLLARRHPKRCGKLATKTVEEWIAKGAWRERKAKLLVEAEAEKNSRIVDRYAELNGILDDVITGLATRFEDAKESEVKSAEQVAYALLNAIGHRQKGLADLLAGDLKDASEINLFFQALEEDPELGPVYRKRRDHVFVAYRGKLKSAGLVK